MYEKLYECLLNSEENGFSVWDWNAIDIAEDVVEKTGMFEDVPIEEVAEVIQKILDKHKTFYK